ncbi:MAG TPA: hypothetical protein VEU29_07695 [Actinomycetota bacterium]|nr:hypothetical protein [Actinomycetota bacterium]
MSKKLLVALTAALAAAAVMPMGAAQAAKKPSSMVVGTDAEGDWGDGSNTAVGDALGQDLKSATIAMADAKTVNFVIGLKSLPAAGGAPEVSRYTWDFAVDGEHLELDGKFTNYSRGACDPTSGHCPPPRDPGLQPFLLRGNCGTDATLPVTLTVCEELAKVQAVFDPAAATITIPVSVDALGAKPGSKISGVAGTFGGTISAAPSAFVTSDSMPMDVMVTTKTFTLPKK